MKHLITRLLAGVLILTAFTASAEYTTSVGARAGKFAHGLVVKHFINANANTGFEVLGAWTKEGNDGYTIRAFMLKQLPIFDSKLQIPVDFIIGFGIHTARFEENYYDVVDGGADYYDKKTFAAGVGATLQLEYDSERVPFTIGIDANPFYNVVNPGPEWLDLGVSVRWKF